MPLRKYCDGAFAWAEGVAQSLTSAAAFFYFSRASRISSIWDLPAASPPQTSMGDAADAPNALWYWQTDQGHWHAYSAALSLALEDAHATKATRFPVDAERYVDTVKMEQRRLDHTGKARAVKREVQLALKAFTFAAVGKPRDDIVSLISDHGGIVTLFLTELVCSSLNRKIILQNGH